MLQTSTETGKDTGAVYTYIRLTREDSFTFEMQLQASNVRPFDRQDDYCSNHHIKTVCFTFELIIFCFSAAPVAAAAISRLGTSVGIYNSVIIVGSCEYYENSALAFQKLVQVVTVQAMECCVRKTYRLGWKVQCQPGKDCVRQWTRKIDSDAEADTLKSILEEV